MPWSMLWVYAALLPVAAPPAQLVAGLAASAAVLLAVVLAAALLRSVSLPTARSHGFPAAARRGRFRSVPRLIDPDAAGRPRSRAPSVAPSAA